MIDTNRRGMFRRQKLASFIAHPIQTLTRIWHKRVVAPRRYTAGNGRYDARGYWTERLLRYGESLQGPGDEGLNAAENAREYQQALLHFETLCDRLTLDYGQAAVLEIGPGTGYYTDSLFRHGVSSYLGADISGALLPSLGNRFPAFRFVQADVTELPLRSTFDLIVIIDVIEHIVRREDLCKAFASLHSCLAPGGTILLAPVLAHSSRHLFYVHFWSESDISACLPGYEWIDSIDFRTGRLVALRRPHTRS